MISQILLISWLKTERVSEFFVYNLGKKIKKKVEDDVQ